MLMAMAACSSAERVLGVNDADAVTGHFALSLPTGSTIASVSYQVVSSAGVTLLTGTSDLSERSAQLSLDLVLAPAQGDVVALSAQTSTGAACAGTSAPFDVVAGRPTFVNLALVCGGDQPSSSRCPVIQSWTVVPTQASAPDGFIDVAVTASDPSGTDRLTYTWFAAAGTFADPAAASTTYRCTAIGPQTLTLTVSDGQSSPVCTATGTFLVGCGSGADAGLPADGQ
jgi:hypothetical protein